jgi:hypothetical protein
MEVVFHRYRISVSALLVTNLLLGAFCLPAWGEQPAVTSADLPVLKAVVVYKICKFITWPDDARQQDENLVIGVLGEDDTGPDFTTVAGKSWGRGMVEIRQVDETANLDGCDVLFVNISQQKRWLELKQEIAHQPLLTISDHPEFTAEEGMVQLVKENNRLRFVINRDVATQSGLQFSSQLLKIARVTGTKDKIP